MTIVIVMDPNGGTPSILQDSDADKLASLLTLIQYAPDALTPQSARVWLRTLPAPSGWYDSEEEAKAAIDQLKRQPRYTGKTVAKAREELGTALGLDEPVSRVKLAEMLGYEASGRNKGDIIGRIERGLAVMGPDKSAALDALLAEHQMNISGTSM